MVTLTFRDASGHLLGTETIAATAIHYTTTLGKRRAAEVDSLHIYQIPQLKNNSTPMTFEMTAFEQAAAVTLFGLSYSLAPGYSIEVSPLRKSVMFTSSRTLAVEYSSVQDTNGMRFNIISNFQAMLRYRVPMLEGLVGQQYASISSFENGTSVTVHNSTYTIAANETRQFSVSAADSIIADAPIAVLTYGRAANGTLLGMALR
jgi:hypothetical protein